MDNQRGPLLSTISAHKGGVGFVAIAPDGQHFTSAGKDGTIKTWNLLTGELDLTRSKPYTPSGRRNSEGFDASADNRIIASYSGGTIWIWDPRTGETANAFASEKGPINCVSISCDGELLTYGSGKQVKVYTVASGQLLRTLECEHSVNGVAISADKQIVANGGDWTTDVKLWDVNTGGLLNTLPDSGVIKGVSCVLTFAPAILASTTKDKSIKIWNPKTGELLRTLYGHSQSILSIAISANGNRIASGGYDETVRVWDLQTGALIRVLSSHLERVNSVALSPDGQLVASGYDDGTVKIWRLGAT